MIRQYITSGVDPRNENDSPIETSMVSLDDQSNTNRDGRYEKRLYFSDSIMTSTLSISLQSMTTTM